MEDGLAATKGGRRNSREKAQKTQKKGRMLDAAFWVVIEGTIEQIITQLKLVLSFFCFLTK